VKVLQPGCSPAILPSASFVQMMLETALTAARNLASLPLSADSMRFQAVMSRAIFEAPMISPEATRIGETVSEMSSTRPSLVCLFVS
jgi:hypothetical protein